MCETAVTNPNFFSHVKTAGSTADLIWDTQAPSTLCVVFKILLHDQYDNISLKLGTAEQDQ